MIPIIILKNYYIITSTVKTLKQSNNVNLNTLVPTDVWTEMFLDNIYLLENQYETLIYSESSPALEQDKGDLTRQATLFVVLIS